jgi:hypothetical protein
MMTGDRRSFNAVGRHAVRSARPWRVDFAALVAENPDRQRESDDPEYNG